MDTTIRKPVVDFGEVVWIDDTSAYEGLPGKIVIVGVPGEYSKWAVFHCPCGCSTKLLINLAIKQGKPVWSLIEHANGRISLEPSIQLTDKCCSHFFIRESRVDWCGE